MIKPHCCPVCDKQMQGTPISQSQFPFCSDRCRQIDLYRWSEGKYAIVQDLDPEVAEFMRDDPSVTVLGEGTTDDSDDDA